MATFRNKCITATFPHVILFGFHDFFKRHVHEISQFRSKSCFFVEMRMVVNNITSVVQFSSRGGVAESEEKSLIEYRFGG